jgi:hypothetical protein
MKCFKAGRRGRAKVAAKTIRDRIDREGRDLMANPMLAFTRPSSAADTSKAAHAIANKIAGGRSG